jgi:hypothetical protein
MRTMPIQPPVLLFLVIFAQASQAPLRGLYHSAINNSYPEYDAGGQLFRRFVPVQATYD